MKIYEVPATVKELFEEKEAEYKIVDYLPEMEMDNNQSMAFFLDYIGAVSDNIIEDSGTQVIIQHEDFDYKLQIDSGGLGDFFSHRFEVSMFNQ